MPESATHSASTAPAATPGPSLGALHRLSHRKIVIGEERERSLIRQFVARFGPGARDTLETARSGHAPFLGDSRLEDLGEQGPLHAVLEGIAARQAEREAATVGALVAQFGDEAEVEIRLASYDHGWKTGDRLARVLPMGDARSPSAVFDLLAEHFPDGLACCPSIRLLADDGAGVSWAQFGPEIVDTWTRMKAPVEVMCSMVAFWCKGFGEGINPEIVYRRGKSLAAGDPYLEGSYRIGPRESASAEPA